MQEFGSLGSENHTQAGNEIANEHKTDPGGYHSQATK